MRISTRNQWKGIVEEIRMGSAKSEIEVRISDELVLTAVITNHSVQNLNLKHGDEVYAFVSASDVILGFERLRISAHNVLKGVVEKVAESSVNTEVILNLGAIRMTSVITKFSESNLVVTKGENLNAIISGYSVMLGKVS